MKREDRSRFAKLPGVVAVAVAVLSMSGSSARAQCSSGGGGLAELASFSVSASSGEKPQSKLWQRGGEWYAVMPDNSGTWLRHLNGTSWTKELLLSSSSGARADVVRDGDVTHILLYEGSASKLVSVEYSGGSYVPWSARPGASSISLGSSGEAGTIAIDTTGRMWAVSDPSSSIQAWYSDPPYSSWSGPVTVASGITSDDLGLVTRLGGGKIGVMWSNQNSERFGFKTHTDGASPSSWSSDESPASQSALNVGNGMADDHINVALGSDGTLYAAVKTSYDTGGYPKLALLVRHSNGNWDNLRSVTGTGTRPIVVIDTDANRLIYAYTASEGYHDLLYRESPLSSISFGSAQTLVNGSVNNVTSTKDPISGGAVFLAAGSSSAASAKFGGVSWGGTADHVGEWAFESGGGTLSDDSGYGNDAATVGSYSIVPGISGSALQLTGGYAVVPDDASLAACQGVTLAAWIRPDGAGTQYVLKKAISGSEDGYELSLSSSGVAFVRFNQASSGNNYRVESTTDYPTNGSTWMHLAATYDGSKVRLYVNGAPDDSLSASFQIASNSLQLAIGAGSSGSQPFHGTIDEANVYTYALSAAEVAQLAAPPVGTAAPEVAGARALVAMPNPFSLRTTITTPSGLATGPVRVYDIRGRLVRELRGTPGRTSVDWDGRDQRGERAAGGIYLVRAGDGDNVRTTKVVLHR
jgi:Concanavalin A-like lectin/glucanases superfamily